MLKLKTFLLSIIIFSNVFFAKEFDELFKVYTPINNTSEIEKSINNSFNIIIYRLSGSESPSNIWKIINAGNTRKDFIKSYSLRNIEGNGFLEVIFNKDYLINVFNELGFISTPLDVRDFKIALKNDDIDAQENPLTNYWNFGVQHKQKYLTLSSHLFGFCLFVMNDTFFNGLSNHEKKLLTKASEDTTAYQYELAEEDDKKLIDLIKKENVQIYELTHHEKEQLLDRVKHFHNEFFTKYPNMKF